MKILRILGAVLAVHLLAFVFIFTSPGCQTGPRNVPTPDATVMDGARGAPASNLDFADPVPAYTPAATAGRAAPTRPGSPNAAVLAPAKPAVTGVTPVTAYTVERGDSLWSIAKKNKLTVAELARANSLGVSATLRPGQKLIIPGQPVGGAPLDLATTPAGPTYTVLPGDTLAGIARMHGVSTADLRAANNRTADLVRVGEKLNLPGNAKPATTVADPGATAGRAPEGTTHTVAAGESLGVIARKYHVTVGELAAANNITDPSRVRAGQQLVIPGLKGTAAKPAAPATPAPAQAAAPASTAGPTFDLTPPPPGQDLDAGLRDAETEVPTIKVEDPPKS